MLKPNGTIWVTGTHHVIFSIGYAMQQLGFKILNDIAWEKPNPPPNLSCRYFTHSTETVLWAAKNEKSKHVFNYQAMRKVTGKQMKTVWRDLECGDTSPLSNDATCRVEPSADKVGRAPARSKLLPAGQKLLSGDRSEDRSPRAALPVATNPPIQSSINPAPPADSTPDSIWTIGAPSTGEKLLGKHPTQKPVALIERCLLAATNEGDLVLDPFLGGGTTTIAALRLKRGCVGIEADLAYIALAAKRCDREIVEIWLRHFRVRVTISVTGRAGSPLPAVTLRPREREKVAAGRMRGVGNEPTERRARTPTSDVGGSDAPYHQIPLDLFPDSINGSRDMADVPQIETERIYHECKFVFLACRAVASDAKAGAPLTSSTGAVVHTTVDVSLQEAWAKTPTGKKRETTHVVRCETEIFRVKVG